MDFIQGGNLKKMGFMPSTVKLLDELCKDTCQDARRQETQNLYVVIFRK